MASRTVQSNQTRPHHRLLHRVNKHLTTAYQKPFQTHNLEAFDRLVDAVQTLKPASVIMDSCCGTGQSTHTLARLFPKALIVGIDRSSARLNKHSEARENTLLLQANCEDIWRLCVANKVQIQHHFILYPNPYPKAEQLLRRWHGHPVFPYLPALCKSLTLRSNWAVYLEEFAQSWAQATGDQWPVSCLDSAHAAARPMTLFERKYALGNQPLYEYSTASAPSLSALTV